ncbi:MAG: alpha-amylase [Erysipelotrichaceae bacterium]|nr:alpha-amylase [Erysipelotrichaceae bacterium]
MIKKLLLSLVILISLLGCNKEEVYDSDVYYEIFVASFNDSDNDGIGDLKGVTLKLPYLKSLGIGGIWLMPIMKSETYHKYDVDNYYLIDSDYGTMDDFKELVDKANELNIDIIIDLPLNHTSDSHEWFISAKENKLNDTCNPDNKCDYYNFSDTKESGYEPLGDKYYYEARFWSGMPDLNLDSENVRNEIKDIVEFWMDTGIKGFRLDAVLYYYQNNVSKNNEFVSWLMEIVRNKREDAFVVGEVWSSENIILDSYGSGIDSLFDFTMSGQDGFIAKAIRSENGQFLASKMIEYNDLIKEGSVNSIFLSNHDQSRSAGYFIDEDKQKLAASVYLLSIGIPFVYYGEEIGMRGSGKDENKRLAMLWGEGSDTCSPIDSDYTSQVDTSVKEQLKDENSLLNHYKKVIKLRNKYIYGKDYSEFIVDNEKIFSINYEGNVVLINMSEDIIEIDIKGKLLDQVDVIDKSVLKDKLAIGGYGVVILEVE